MNIEDLRNIAQVAQAVIVACGALIGSIWVLLRFRLTRESERATLELERAKAAAYSLRGVAGEITVQHYALSPSGYCLSADIIFTNLSDRVRVFDTADYPFRVIRVGEPSDYASFEEIDCQRIQIAPLGQSLYATRFLGVLTLWPSTPRRLSFFSQVTTPGYYLVSFVTEYVMPTKMLPDDEAEFGRADSIYSNFKDHPDSDPRWSLTVDKYYYIPPP